MNGIGSMLDVLFNFKYLLLISFLLGVVVLVEWISYNRLSNFKGPFWASVTNLWMAKSVYYRNAHLDLFHAYQEYGELARIGPNVLLTGDPDLIQHMSSARSGYTRAEWYAGQKLEVGQDNLLSTVDENIHSTKRAQMAIGYSGKDVEGVEAALDKYVLEFLALIRRKYITTGSELRPLDLARRVSFFVMDFTTDIAFGTPWGCLANDEDVGKWFESATVVLPIVIMVSTVPWLAKLFSIPIVGKFVGPSEKDKTGPGRILKAVKDVVRRRFALADHEQKRDMMGSFIRHGLSSKDVVAEATLQIAVGTDTTATTIRTTMLYIMTNSQVYAKLQAEIDATLREGQVISDSQARTLPYLQAVIKEGSRICPPATGILSKKAPPTGDTFKGRFIPAGTEIGQCAWALHRSTEVYGDDSMIFRPERWLEAEGEDLKKMEKSLGLIWGYGRYSCLGKHTAFLELNKIFFELLKHFHFTLIDPTRPWKCENVGLWLQSELYVKVTEREAHRMVI